MFVVRVGFVLAQFHVICPFHYNINNSTYSRVDPYPVHCIIAYSEYRERIIGPLRSATHSVFYIYIYLHTQFTCCEQQLIILVVQFTGWDNGNVTCADSCAQVALYCLFPMLRRYSVN